MHIGIYGGSFNPPHIAHLIVAEQARSQFGLDKVLWIPNHIPPHKSAEAFASPHDRLEMTRHAIQSNPAFEISSIELDRKGTSFMVDTVQALRENAPADSFYLIIGGDSLADFMTWHEPESIVAQVPLLVYRRPGANQNTTPVEKAFPGRVHFVDAPPLEVSSKSIRDMVRANQSIRYLLPDSVLTYIQQNQLYRQANDIL